MLPVYDITFPFGKRIHKRMEVRGGLGCIQAASTDFAFAPTLALSSPIYRILSIFLKRGLSEISESFWSINPLKA